MDIAEAFELLSDKNNNTAYKALQSLQEESDGSDIVYSYMDRLEKMLENDNSYIRTRALTLIAHNAKWDKDNKINLMLGSILSHINDEKPVISRQCIKLLPLIAESKPELKNDILSALNRSDISACNSSMQSLIIKDIRESVGMISELQ